MTFDNTQTGHDLTYVYIRSLSPGRPLRKAPGPQVPCPPGISQLLSFSFPCWRDGSPHGPCVGVQTQPRTLTVPTSLELTPLLSLLVLPPAPHSHGLFILQSPHHFSRDDPRISMGRQSSGSSGRAAHSLRSQRGARTRYLAKPLRQWVHTSRLALPQNQGGQGCP